MSEGLKKDQVVVKHNSLIRSRYDYSLAELRLVITIASMIHPDDEDFRKYVLKAKDYAELIDSKHKNEYQKMRELGSKLMSKPLRIPNEDGFLICNWLSSFRYISSKGEIVCSFTPDLRPYLLQLREKFTSYTLENILKFRSVYSIRFYELFKSWQGTGKMKISVAELRELLGLEDRYPLYGDLKRRVLSKALKEINEYSDLTVKMEEIKKGRKIEELAFSIKSKAGKWLDNEKSFISAIRKNYQPDPENDFYPTIFMKQMGEEKFLEVKVDLSGKLYVITEGEIRDLDSKKSREWWSFLYELALKGEISEKPER